MLELAQEVPDLGPMDPRQMAAINANLGRTRAPNLGAINANLARRFPSPAPRTAVDRGLDVPTGQTDSTRPPGRFSKEMLNKKNLKRGALVAAGVLAAGSVVQSRRREGSPPGRQSMYRN